MLEYEGYGDCSEKWVWKENRNKFWGLWGDILRNVDFVLYFRVFILVMVYMVGERSKMGVYGLSILVGVRSYSLFFGVWVLLKDFKEKNEY